MDANRTAILHANPNIGIAAHYLKPMLPWWRVDGDDRTLQISQVLENGERKDVFFACLGRRRFSLDSGFCTIHDRHSSQVSK